MMIMMKIYLIIFTLLISHSVFSKGLVINDTKEQCQKISNSFIAEKYGKKEISYLEYSKLVNSRKKFVKKGELIKTYVLQDKYAFKSIDEGIKLYKLINGISSETFKESEIVTLPFCTNALKREIASIEKIDTKVEKKIRPKNKKLSFGLSAQYGNLEVKNSLEEYSMNFIKVSGNSNFILNEKYFLSTNLSVVQFRDIKHSGTDIITESSDPYPEFGTTLYMKNDRVNIGVGYEVLQYFVRDNSLKGIALAPSVTHRVSSKLAYSFSGKIKLKGNLGVLQSFEKNNIRGFDAAIGASFTFGKQMRISLTPILYKGVIQRDSSSNSDDSTVIAATFSYRL